MKTPIDPSRAMTAELVRIDEHGVETLLTVRIGFPLPQQDAFACPCEIEGIWKYVDIVGNDPIQAMSLTLRFVHSQLASLIKKGNRLYLSTDRSAPLTPALLDVWFGVR